MPDILERDIVMGTFTRRTQYLPGLLDSVKQYLPEAPLIIKVNEGGINKNMEMLRQDFLCTDKRFWVFLDDDIRFMDSDILKVAVHNLVTHKVAMVGVYSTFDPEYKLGSDSLTFNEVPWTPGYFMMVDRNLVGNIKPDLNLPDANTSVDTSYCISIRHAGFKIGISPSVVYHTYKRVLFNQDIGEKTNEYLKAKWGDFYFNNTGRLANIVGSIPKEYE